MNSWLARKFYLGLQTLRGESIGKALLDVRRTEFISQDELRAIQSARQLDQLRYAIQNVPFYERAYAPLASEISAASSWVDTRSIMDRLPVIEKDIVRKTPELFTSRNAARLRTYPDKTSGSTGTPLTFPCDQHAWAYRHALIYRCMESFGVQLGEKYAYYYGLHWSKRTQRHLKLRDWFLNRIRISAYQIERKYLEEQFAALQAYRPTHILGYPSAIYEFCSLLNERGWDLLAVKLKAVFLTAESLFPYQRSLIEKVTGSLCVNIYGSAEGGTSAFECPHGNLHIAAESTWVSLPSPDQNSGDIQVTDMMLRAFPMIRYAIGDEVALSGKICSCGRPHPLIASILGRSGKAIVLPNGKQINSHIPGYIFKPLGALGVIRKFRFVHQGDLLSLYLVVTDNFKQEYIQLIKREISIAFGEDISCAISVVDDLPHMPNAKFCPYIKLES